MQVKYGIIGGSGKMGREIESLFDEAGHKCVFKFDVIGEWKSGNPQVIIDFSLPQALNNTILYVKKFNIPLIIGTTGLSVEQIESLKTLSRNVPIVQSYNFSIGMQMLLKCTEMLKENLPDWDVEISETHHRFKKDKPSGTALMIRNVLGKNVNISSLRIGNVPGDHTVYFGSLGEVISIKHSATSRRTFTEGVLKSVQFVMGKKKGLYSFNDVLFQNKRK
ncbi:MAG: dihydrodipicolinate reductase C-terminal domain-containing protein [Ignavibacteriaceae bacterium]|nr:dihydrodipicolinate reductase C-terminal domain-containing protein [Ignavibacteriaceae bacterium]